MHCKQRMLEIRALFLLLLLGSTACASVQDRYVASPLDARGQLATRHDTPSGLVISGEELSAYASEYFGALQITFENKSAGWVTIERLSLDFGGARQNLSVVYPDAPQIDAWLSATLQRNVMRDTNETLALATLLAIGATVERIGDHGRRRELAAAGSLLGAAAATAAVVDSASESLAQAESAQLLPDSHLLALPIRVPPQLFSKRWVLLNTRAGAPCLRAVRLDYHLQGRAPESVFLTFRRRNERSAWQQYACQR